VPLINSTHCLPLYLPPQLPGGRPQSTPLPRPTVQLALTTVVPGEGRDGSLSPMSLPPSTWPPTPLLFTADYQTLALAVAELDAAAAIGAGASVW
jgi:hypothetical protein